MSERTEGVLFNREDGVFFVPEDQLGQYRVEDAEAEKVRSAAGDGEVSGFRSAQLRPNVKQISWGFSGPVVLAGTYSLLPTGG